MNEENIYTYVVAVKISYVIRFPVFHLGSPAAPPNSDRLWFLRNTNVCNVYIRMYVCIRIYTFITYIYGYMYIRIYTNIYTYIYEYVYECISVFVYVYTQSVENAKGKDLYTYLCVFKCFGVNKYP